MTPASGERGAGVEPEGLDGEVRGTKSKMLEYLNMALRELGSCELAAAGSRLIRRGSARGAAAGGARGCIVAAAQAIPRRAPINL
jgi:hypothetical protein